MEYIIITGYASIESAAKAVRHRSIIAYETKPLNIDQLMALVQQVIERKRAEEALRESEQNFRNSIENSPLGIVIMDALGEMVYINQAHLDIYGYSSLEELKAVPMKVRYAPQTWPEVEERIKKRQLGESVANNFQVSIVRKDGEIRHLEVFTSEVLWNGEINYQLLYKDITERKQAEEALRQSEARFRFVAETANDAIISIDSQAIITFWNRRAETMFGYSGDEIIGQMLTVIIPPRFHAHFLEGMKQLNLGTDLSFIGTPWETLGLRKDGSEFPSELSLAMWELNGKTFFTSIVRDITERRTAQ